jgi:glycogen(starch) synthase
VKILHLSSEYPPAKIYGLGRFVHGLARAQAAIGDHVSVLTNSCGGDEDAVVLDGVHVHRIEFPNPPRPADGHGEVLQFNHGLVARFFDRKKDFEGTDVVCSHDWLTALAAREVATELKAPLVVTFHDEVIGKHFGLLDDESRFVSELEALTAHDATHVIANSEFIARQLARHYGAERVTAIPGGIDPAVLEPSKGVKEFKLVLSEEDETLVTFLGRLDAEKGLEELAEAALIAGAVKPKLRFAIAGTGRGEERLRQKLAPLGERARLLGYVQGAPLSLLYRASDVVVVPSLYEPFGLVALEAMLAGAGVIVSNAGGLAEIVRHEKDGLVIPMGNAAALAEAIVQLAHEPDYRRKLAESAQERARSEFSWARIAEKTRTVYQRSIETKRPVVSLLPPVPRRPLVSVTLVTHNAPVHAEAALRSLFSRTDYPEIEAIVADSSPLPWPRLKDVVRELTTKGHRVTLLERLERSSSLEKGLEHVQGDYVCAFADECEVPPGSERWLAGLVWLMETMATESVSPTLEDRRGYDRKDAPKAPSLQPRRDLACCLVRRDQARTLLRDDAQATAHWRHPARIVHAAYEAIREAAPPFAATIATRLPVSIAVVAYNNLDLTRECIDSVLANTKPPYELVLVNNGSSDGTREYFSALRDQLGGPVPVQVLENPENKGYVLAANQAIRAARGSSVVLLNNDATVRPDWLPALLTASRVGGSVGIVTAKVLNLDGTVQSAGGILHRLDGGFTIPFQGEDRLAPCVTERRDVENAGGPCMLLTRELLLSVGVFDEAYSPAYFEDSDLCMRARAAGLRLVYEPRAEVFHHGKATAQAVAREGKLGLWERFEENKKLFLSRWAKELGPGRPVKSVRKKRLPRVLLCYNANATTTAAYCEAALRREADVVTAGRGQDVDMGDTTASEIVSAAGGHFDLLLAIEGENYLPRELDEAPCTTAFWAIDNHIHASREDGWHFEAAADFDHVFLAQRDYLEAFRDRGIQASWLPLACDPDVHRKREVEPDLDVVFVGNVRPCHARRRALLDRLAKNFRVHEIQGAYRDDMARFFSRARVVFNCSLAGDLNMRVFEALSCGSLLVTDRIKNGLEDVFADGEHLALYDDASLEAVVAHYLTNPAARREIAARGEKLVRAHHTYGHRMRTVLERAGRTNERKARVS